VVIVSNLVASGGFANDFDDVLAHKLAVKGLRGPPALNGR
jgi:hypothetical protein